MGYPARSTCNSSDFAPGSEDLRGRCGGSCKRACAENVARSDALLATLARAALHSDELALAHGDLAFRVLAQVLIWSGPTR